jgi:hypothetical protein
VFLCTPAFGVQPAGVFIDHKKFCPCRKQAFIYGAVRFGLCTQLFLFNKICCLFDNKNWENFGNFCGVNSTHFAILFWNGIPNFQYQKIEKKK